MNFNLYVFEKKGDYYYNVTMSSVIREKKSQTNRVKFWGCLKCAKRQKDPHIGNDRGTSVAYLSKRNAL